MKPFYSLLALIIVLFASSCSIQKRVHTHGFHAEWTNLKQNHKIPIKHAVPKHAVSVNEPELHVPELTATASLQPAEPVFMPEQYRVLQAGKTHALKPVADTCDRIKFKTGSELEVRMMHIGNDSVKYTFCNDASGTVYQLKTDALSKIVYANGLVVLFDEVPPKEPDLTNRKVPDSILMSMAFGIVGFFLIGIPFGLTAVVLGIIGITRVQKDPKKYKGIGLAALGVILGFIDIIGALIVISTMK